jgi:hypothetical protein
LEEAILLHHVERRIAGRHRERIASKVEPCVPGGHALAGFLGEEGADRKPAPSARRATSRRADAGALIGE